MTDVPSSKALHLFSEFAERVNGEFSTTSGLSESELFEFSSIFSRWADRNLLNRFGKSTTLSSDVSNALNELIKTFYVTSVYKSVQITFQSRCIQEQFWTETISASCPISLKQDLWVNFAKNTNKIDAHKARTKYPVPPLFIPFVPAGYILSRTLEQRATLPVQLGSRLARNNYIAFSNNSVLAEKYLNDARVENELSISKLSRLDLGHYSSNTGSGTRLLECQLGANTCNTAQLESVLRLIRTSLDVFESLDIIEPL